MLANKLLARFKNLAAANPNTTVTVSSRLKSKPFKKSFSYLAATDAEGEKFEGLVKSVVAVIVGQLK